MTTSHPASLIDKIIPKRITFRLSGARFFRNLPIGPKLGLGFGLLVTLTIILGVVLFVTTNQRNVALEHFQVAEERAQLAEISQKELEQARRFEESFLARHTIEGFDTAYLNYVLPYRQHVQALHNLVAEIRSVGGSDSGSALVHLDHSYGLELIDTISLDYEQSFGQVVDTIEARGFEETGMEGRFRQAAQAIEDSPVLQDRPELQVSLLQMRRHEKDWALRSELPDVEVVNSYGEKLKNQVHALDLAASEQAGLLNLIDDYLVNFNNSVEADLRVAEQRAEFRRAAQSITSLLVEVVFKEEVVADRAQDQVRHIEDVAWTVNLTLLSTAILAGLGLAYVVTRSIAGPITHLTAVARRVTAGYLEVRARVESQDEIGQLALAFNSMTAQLSGLISSLEDQVQERTAELALSMEVGQRAATIKDLAELLPTITEFIRERFDLYYTHIYFVDDIGENLVIKAGTGIVGQELLARRYSLPVGAGSIVGRVAAEGRSIVVSDTETSDIHKPNPLLPETRSELAVPLVVEERVLGVLDMQSDRVNTFTEANLTVFEAMATQLAISIDSAQQWTLAQDAQQKTQEALRQMTREVWTEKLAAQKKVFGFAYDLIAVTPIPQTDGRMVANGLSAPVLVQNEPIGCLSVEMSPDKAWSDDERVLLGAVAQQLAQKVENLRLFEATQQRAAREQLARQITDRIRASQDIETALKTAAEELNKALGTARAVIDLELAPADERIIESASRQMDEAPHE